LVTYKNVTKCVAEWADLLGIKSSLIYDRLKRGGKVEDILLNL